MNSRVSFYRSAAMLLVLSLSVIVGLAPFVPASASPSAPGPDTFQAGQIVIGLLPGNDINAFNARHNTRILDRIAGTDQFLLAIPPGTAVEDILAEVAPDPALEFAAKNFSFLSPEVRQVSHAFVDQVSHAFVDGQSPGNYFTQPSLGRLRLSQAHQITRGLGVIVAVIDTGLDFNHPLFAGRIAWPNYDFVDNDGTPREVSGGAGYGHGTFVAGLIVLTAPQARIMPIRAFDRDGRGTSFNVAKAIRFARDNGADVINLSFGLLEQDPLIQKAVTYAHERTFQVASAGNDNENFLHFPAERTSKTFAVTSTDANDIRAPFANFDRDVLGSAPGVSLYSAYPGNKWAYWSGTSFSTALVSGQAALLLSIDPSIGRSRMNDIITSSGVNIDSLNPGYSRMLGRRIDYLGAINQVLFQ